MYKKLGNFYFMLSKLSGSHYRIGLHLAKFERELPQIEWYFDIQLFSHYLTFGYSKK